MGQVRKTVWITEKAEQELGFKAVVTLEDGLRKTIQWTQENRADC